MIKNIKIPESIGSRTEYKTKFSLLEMYRAFVLIPGAVTKMITNKRKKLIGNDLIERLQLSVTEVNGCPACSYAHTYVALKQGMSNEEITSFLNGDGAYIKEEEAKAIVFAQHFADSRGFPQTDAYQSLIDQCGKEKAGIILSAVRIMLAGNIYGIPYSAFRSRVKGRAYKNSSLIYELGMLLAGLIILPIALIHGVFKTFIGSLNIRFDNADQSDKIYN